MSGSGLDSKCLTGLVWKEVAGGRITSLRHLISEISASDPELELEPDVVEGVASSEDIFSIRFFLVCFLQ